MNIGEEEINCGKSLTIALAKITSAGLENNLDIPSIIEKETSYIEEYLKKLTDIDKDKILKISLSLVIISLLLQTYENTYEE